MSGLRISAVNQRAAGGILNTHVCIGTHNVVCILKYNMHGRMLTTYYVFHHNAVEPNDIKYNLNISNYSIFLQLYLMDWKPNVPTLH